MFRYIIITIVTAVFLVFMCGCKTHAWEQTVGYSNVTNSVALISVVNEQGNNSFFYPKPFSVRVGVGDNRNVVQFTDLVTGERKTYRGSYTIFYD